MNKAMHVCQLDSIWHIWYSSTWKRLLNEPSIFNTQVLLNSGSLGLLNDFKENIEISHCTTGVVSAKVHVCGTVDVCSAFVFCWFACCWR